MLTLNAVTDGINRLTWEYGVLGIFSVFFIIALVWLVKQWRTSMLSATADAKEFAKSLTNTASANSKLLVETHRFNDALRAAFDSVKTELTNHKRAVIENIRTESVEHRRGVEEISDKINRLCQEQVRLVDSIRRIENVSPKHISEDDRC